MKSKLLIVELWGLGDLVIATPFIRAAAAQYDLTLLAKPYALDLKSRLWPEMDVVSFNAPWTAFKSKYHLWRWPWPEITRLQRLLKSQEFDFGVSGRWDPRDHLLLKLLGVKNRLGFPRLGSHFYLTRPLERPDPLAHHYEYWRIAGKGLGIELPSRENLAVPPAKSRGNVMVHTGARLPARVWPLNHFHQLIQRLRGSGHSVQVVCDPGQLSWWRQKGETGIACPRTVTDLLSLIDQAGVFVGNCSGPGHLAAICGVPTFTLYGPSMYEWFAPLHPQAEIVEGKACPYKPCSDYCRFTVARCLGELTADEVWPRLEKFVTRHFQPSTSSSGRQSAPSPRLHPSRPD